MSVAARIRTVVATRAQAIRQADGYATDMGLRVLRGISPLAVSAADLDIGPVLVVGADPDGQERAVQRVGAQLHNDLRLMATALQLTGDAIPQDVADVLLADLKRALLVDPHQGLRDAAGVLLGGPLEYAGSSFDLPGPGEAIVTVEMTLSCRYAEGYGTPDTPHA